MPSGNIVRGLLRLAIGDAKGIREFSNTPAAFSASIAPLLAFPLVGSVIIGIHGHWLLAAAMLLSRFCGVLLQPVIVEFSAGLTRRRETWLITSTMLNWSIWLVFPLILIGVLVSGGLLTAGVPQTAAAGIIIGLIVLYMLWLQWFILRSGLQTGIWQALAILVAMNVAIAAVYIMPYAFHPQLLSLTFPNPSG